jgi:hypothetical protein
VAVHLTVTTELQTRAVAQVPAADLAEAVEMAGLVLLLFGI